MRPSEELCLRSRRQCNPRLAAAVHPLVPTTVRGPAGQATHSAAVDRPHACDLGGVGRRKEDANAVGGGKPLPRSHRDAHGCPRGRLPLTKGCAGRKRLPCRPSYRPRRKTKGFSNARCSSKMGEGLPKSVRERAKLSNALKPRVPSMPRGPTVPNVHFGGHARVQLRRTTSPMMHHCKTFTPEVRSLLSFSRCTWAGWVLGGSKCASVVLGHQSS